MIWFWLSFADATKPSGQQFLGVAIVQALGTASALAASHARGCNPGGEVVTQECPIAWGSPPPGSANRILTDVAELERIARAWNGCGVATSTEIEKRERS